jgi:hypothetical protein
LADHVSNEDSKKICVGAVVGGVVGGVVATMFAATLLFFLYGRKPARKYQQFGRKYEGMLFNKV